MDQYLLMLPPMIGTVGYILAQVLVFRTGRVRLLVSAMTGLICGGGITFLAHLGLAGSLPTGLDEYLFLSANMMIYLGLAYTYFHFLNMSESARRIRILCDLVEAGDTGATEQQICQGYGSRVMVERRLMRLIANNQIEERDERLYVRNGLVLWISKAIWVLKVILSLKDIESDTRGSKGTS